MTDHLAGVFDAGGRGRRSALRIVLGCLIVLACAAGASAAFVSHELATLVHNISVSPQLHFSSGALAPTPPGGAQTILLVGNDQRAHTTTAPVLPHSNEMLLVRVDPSKPFISMMSLPRELDVPIHTPHNGIVHTRLNATLLYGGIPLLVSTIRQVTGLRVNHVVEIDFRNFKRAVDELGCIWGTIDRRYLHINTPTSQQYQQINLQPGYQRLCGRAALSFVSYRHGDTSLVRDARDQEFLLEAKQQLGPTLLTHLHQFERIFGQTVQTDGSLRTPNGLLGLMATAIAEQGKPVRQVPFHATLLATVDTASPAQIAESVHSFLDGRDVVPRPARAPATGHRGHHSSPGGPLLMRTPAVELAAMRPRASRLPFPLEYPRERSAAAAGGPLQVNGCSGLAEPIVCLREYRIPGRRPHVSFPAYVIVTAQGDLDQYYDVQGSTWTNAPMFDSPTQILRSGSRRYALYYSGAHLTVVAWWEHGAVYWVHNTITDALTNDEMLAIAKSTTPLGHPHPVARRRGRRVVRAVGPPPVAASSAGSPPGGPAAGLLALLACALGGLALLLQRRRIAESRVRIDAAQRRSIRLLGELHELREAIEAASGAPPVPAPARVGSAHGALDHPDGGARLRQARAR
ncbi:MAG TPA: LCP family protein [Solirubrobacteraceae bacterium]|nr:LCP family protein [Solirubrobacteraceae bacterium]